MTSPLVRPETAPLLVAASLATLAALAVLDSGALLPAWLDALAKDPFAGCLALLVAALESMWQRRRIVVLLASGGAAAFGALDVALQLADGRAAFENAALAPPAAGVALAVGLLLAGLLHTPRTRFVALVGGACVSLALCLAMLLVAALGFSAPLPPLARALGVAAAALATFDYQLRGPQHQPARDALRWLYAPVGVAGAAGTALLCLVIFWHVEVPIAERLRWLILVATAALFANAAALAAVRVALQTLTLRKLDAKRRVLVRRQRGALRERLGALNRARLQYDGLFASVPAAVLLTDSAGTIKAANPAMLRLLGVSSDAAVKGRNFGDFYANPSERGPLIDEWHASGIDLREGEVALRRADGEEIHVLYAGRLVKDEHGRVQHRQGTFTDISPLRREEARRRKLEGHLRLSQKLESVGRLAAGIAHEINTPLQYVGDNVFFLRGAFDGLGQFVNAARPAVAAALERNDVQPLREVQRVEQDSEIADLLTHVPRALTRAGEGLDSVKKIVAAMKELAHPDQGAKSGVDINGLVETALVISKHEYKTIATVQTVYSSVPPVLAYKTELCQVLINLIVNAAHAIESAKALDHRAGVIRIETEALDGRVCIRVRDNGCGIPDAVRDRIFDPFFTTKAVGKGTGQGLAIARTTVVEKHGGELKVDSSVGVGTTFTIELPLD